MLSGLRTLAVYHGAAFRIYEVNWLVQCRSTFTLSLL